MSELRKWNEFCEDRQGTMAWRLDNARWWLKQYVNALREFKGYEINPDRESGKIDDIDRLIVEIRQREKKIG